MTSSGQVMDASDFLETLDEGTARVGAEAHIPLANPPDLREISLPVKLLQRPAGPLENRPLLVTFAGSVDQTKQGFPCHPADSAHQGLGDAGATVLSIADPALWLASELRTGWYQVGKYADVPGAIEAFVTAVSHRLNPSRLIFAGSSNGAHAAMMQATRFPDCVCIAFNPITRISGYFKQHVERYLSICWDGARIEDLPPDFVDDCGALYRAGHAHALIIVQNATDPHLLGQAVPFAAQVQDHERLLFLTDFFPDSLGHRLPGKLRADWLKAAVHAPAAECLEIARLRAELSISSQAIPAPERSRSSAAPDLDLAARLAAAALQK